MSVYFYEADRARSADRFPMKKIEREAQIGRVDRPCCAESPRCAENPRCAESSRG